MYYFQPVTTLSNPIGSRQKPTGELSSTSHFAHSSEYYVALCLSVVSQSHDS